MECQQNKGGVTILTKSRMAYMVFKIALSNIKLLHTTKQNVTRPSECRGFQIKSPFSIQHHFMEKYRDKFLAYLLLFFHGILKSKQIVPASLFFFQKRMNETSKVNCFKFPISDRKRALYYSFFKILFYISGKADGGFA